MVCLAAAVGFSQGLVDFRNHVLPESSDHRIYTFDDTPLVGTNFVAQLYYGSDVWTLRPVLSSPARFRNVTPGSTLAGTWSGGYRTLDGFSPGNVVTMVVKVWDSTRGSTPEEAGQNGGLAFAPPPFTYTLPPPDTGNPTNYYMYNFRACHVFGCCHCWPPPQFDSQPQSRTVALGSQVTLLAAGYRACFVEWRFNETTSLPATWSRNVHNGWELVLTNLQMSHAGNYQLRLGNYGGVVTSEVAVLTVVTPPRLDSPARGLSEFRFYVPGESGRAFAVETTAGLHSAAWMPVYTNVAPFWFTNSTADADRQRFYRAVLR
jgi:hypothetical protein